MERQYNHENPMQEEEYENDIFEPVSKKFFYDDDPEFVEGKELYHAIESDKKEVTDIYNEVASVSKHKTNDRNKKSDIKNDDKNDYGEELERKQKDIGNSGQRMSRISLFALIGIGAIVLLIISILLKESNADYGKILSQETSEIITEIYVDDYDGDGKEEAFATTEDSEYLGYENLWYISDQGATIVSECGNLPQMIVVESGEILVPWHASYGATLCYGVYHGQIKELEIYAANIFQREESGTTYAVEEYFTEYGEYHKNIVCEFDEDMFELVYTNEYYESNPTEDGDFCWNQIGVNDFEEEYLGKSQTESNNAVEQNTDDFVESDLYQIALRDIPESIQEWCYEDFDGDGEKEAFVGTGEEESYFTSDGIKSLWYLSDTGVCSCILKEETYWYFPEEPFVFSDCKLFRVEARHGYYFVLGIQENKPVEVKMPEEAEFYWISQDLKSGMILAGDKREERAHVLELDSSKMEFIDTGKTVLNN